MRVSCGETVRSRSALAIVEAMNCSFRGREHLPVSQPRSAGGNYGAIGPLYHARLGSVTTMAAGRLLMSVLGRKLPLAPARAHGWRRSQAGRNVHLRTAGESDMPRTSMLAISLAALLPGSSSALAETRPAPATPAKLDQPFNIGFVLYT